MPILSVIVPVYNVEKYLNECLESISKQSFKDIEIICINDGSTDNSYNILKQWELKDNRIIILSQTNKGLSATRNVGIQKATGKYISFVDSDDKLLSNQFSVIIENMIKNDLDAMGCSFETFPTNSYKTYSFTTNKILNFNELISSNNALQSTNDLCFCWRYFVKREILINNHILFNEKVRFGEDMIFMIDTLAHCQKIYLTDEPLYLYRTDNANSIMKVATYNPHIEKSLEIIYFHKKNQAIKYQIENYSPFIRDLAEYTIKSYIPILFKNAYLKDNGLLIIENLKIILNSPMITDAVKVVGFRNIYSSWKEYIFYLAMKFKCARLVHKLYFT